MIELGDFKLHAISDGFFRLDGGAMFGIVPKPVWQRVTEVDDRNRIQLSLTTLLIQTGDHNVLVDTGIGTKHDEKFNELYAVDHFTTVPESLKKVGLTVDDAPLGAPPPITGLRLENVTVAEYDSLGKCTNADVVPAPSARR